MSRFAALFYGLAVYLLFLVTFLYLIGFTAGILVPKHVDNGHATHLALAIALNVLLVTLFAVQHTIMARPGFKRWITRHIPRAVERSTFVLVASLILLLLFWQWRPIDAVVWHVEHPLGRAIIWASFLFGWMLVLGSTFLINHFDLFGLRQVVLQFQRRDYTDYPFVERAIYRFIRHPLMLGFIIAFWSAPTMTAGHLLFALAMTGYILVGIRFEERDLIRHHGPAYEDYRQRTGMLMPRPRRAPAADVDEPPAPLAP